MSKGIIVDTEYFDGVNLDVPSVKPAFIAKMQENAKQEKLLDDDVMAWAVSQDKETKNYINQMVKGLMIIKQKQVTAV